MAGIHLYLDTRLPVPRFTRGPGNCHSRGIALHRPQRRVPAAVRYQRQRRTPAGILVGGASVGELEAPLSPAAREVLVAIGTDDRPEPPLGPVSLVKEMAVRAVSRASRSTSLTQQGPQPMKAAVLWQASAALEEAKSQASFANLFRAFGVSPRLIPVATLPSTPLNKEEVLVVPHAAAASLSSSDVALISRFVREGGQLVLDDRSPLAVEMGIGYSGLSANIEELSDVADTDLRLRWRPAAVMDQFRLPTDHTVLMRELGGSDGRRRSVPGGERERCFTWERHSIRTRKTQ